MKTVESTLVLLRVRQPEFDQLFDHLEKEPRLQVRRPAEQLLLVKARAVVGRPLAVKND